MAARKAKAKKPPAPKGEPADSEEVEADEEEAEAESDGEEPGEGEEELSTELADDEFVDTTAESADEAPATTSDEARGTSLARLDPMAIYMREVQRHPLLTPEEAHELAVRYAETQDVDAAARLVTSNLRLVVKIAYEYRRAYRNMMDLVQEGNIGLMQAVKRYDPYRGVKLSSYAAWWIRAYILRFILNNWRMVKIGTTQAQRKLFFNLSKEKQRLSAMGIEPTHAEIAKRLNVEEQEVIEMDRRLSRSDASLDASVGDSEGKPTTRMDLLPATSAGPDESAESSEMQELLKQHLAEFRRTLKDKDIAIFDKRIVADEPLTLQELGDEFGVSRERVRQLEARLTGKLRAFLRERLGDAVGVGGA
ncbi:MAG: RNA polymerase factor sigma-32 [Polyangiaceae bacterium]